MKWLIHQRLIHQRLIHQRRGRNLIAAALSSGIMVCTAIKRHRNPLKEPPASPVQVKPATHQRALPAQARRWKP